MTVFLCTSLKLLDMSAGLAFDVSMKDISMNCGF